uniref:Uncharacterized protein n=1 Tax=Anopheles coluzzii TaxID=1518534 RepID=A0A6E8WBV0_ANOCL|nr:uncharacterized protein LOC120957444 [Anopheles coluzzii]
MSIMCTIVSVVLASTLLLASIAFISASSTADGGQHQPGDQQLANHDPNEQGDIWELISAASFPPQSSADRMRRYDRYRGRAHSHREEDDPLQAENSHVVVQVYSVDSDEQQLGNESSPASIGTPIRSLKVENYATPKEQMDGKPTDRVERKVFPPVRNVQEKLDKVISSVEQPEQPEELLSERFFIDDAATKQQKGPNGGRYGGGGNPFDGQTDVESFEREMEQMPLKQGKSAYANSAPFFDYGDHTSQRMLDEFFALRNQDTLAARRSNYDWGEGQLRSRTLEDIEAQGRRVAAGRRKPSGDYQREEDMSYDRYADYAASQQRAGTQKLGRKQRATPSTHGQTHVLNKVPIVAFDGDGSLAPMSGQRSQQFERSRFHYSLPSMVYNPYAAWDPYHLNMLRWPQCGACQQNARALCTKCGLCADCCAHSKCTCGCLNG